MISLTFCLAKSRYFFILFYCIYRCVYLYVFFYINNTTKGNTSLMLNKLLLLYTIRYTLLIFTNIIICNLKYSTKLIVLTLLSLFR